MLSGKADTETIAASMLLAGYLPDRILCSGARRARETWEAAAKHLRLEVADTGPGLSGDMRELRAAHVVGPAAAQRQW